MNALKYLYIIFCLLFSLAARAQYSKFVVQFTDKNNSSYSLTNPAAFLSRTIDRRTRYNISLDSTDLPVSASYIQQVIAAGPVTFLSSSKWLNQILISCNDDKTIAIINSFPFVKSAGAVALIKQKTDVSDKLYEEVIPLPSTQKNNKAAGIKDNFNYGNAYAQIHIHEGEFLHNKGYTGAGMHIAILDAGFYNYSTINAFDSARNNHQILGEKDFVDFDNSVDEDNAHGELCLSTIAANVPGVMVGAAPKASFWLLRSENAATEYPIEEHNWVVAAEFADSAGADIISSSLGYNEFNDAQFNHTYNDFYKNSTMVSAGATYAAKKGMLVTNSAGNEGDNDWKYLIFPADADSVCAVGAVDVLGNIAPFSSYGYPGKVKPNVVSVGAATTVYAFNGLATSNGTSFSNPNLNGLIACLWQAFPAYNNITILNALYKSASRYNNPDDRYGFGIPNMKTAYRNLKTKQNTELYGSDWLFVMPDTFTNKISIKLIGQVDGNAQLNLLSSNGSMVASIYLLTEVAEVYDTAFNNLSSLPPGNYYLQYSDSLTTRSIALFKTGFGENDWIKVMPVPFNDYLTVFVTAPETAKAIVRLIDARGRIIQTQNLTATEGALYQVNFENTAALLHGVYFVEYRSAQHHKTIRVLK